MFSLLENRSSMFLPADLFTDHAQFVKKTFYQEQQHGSRRSGPLKKSYSAALSANGKIHGLIFLFVAETLAMLCKINSASDLIAAYNQLNFKDFNGIINRVGNRDIVVIEKHLERKRTATQIFYISFHLTYPTTQI